MKLAVLIGGSLLAGLIVGSALAQAPSPSPTPPVPTVEPFPSTPQYLRVYPGPEEDSWYVYASGFSPRASWMLVEAACVALPCAESGPPVIDHAREDGTMSFYVQLPRAADPLRERLLALLPGPASGQPPEPASGGAVPAGVPQLRVVGHHPAGGFGYPAGTLTGIAAVDEVVALSQAGDAAALRARLVLKDGSTTAGEAVHGIATWQCQPYVFAENNLAQAEFPSGLVYAVFRIPAGAALPSRYQGAAYGIAFNDGGTGIPLGGLTLVSEDGKIVGTEIRCGTTPGFHVYNFSDFVLAPFQGPAPARPPIIPSPPVTGSGSTPSDAFPRDRLISLGLLLCGAVGLGFVAIGLRSRR